MEFKSDFDKQAKSSVVVIVQFMLFCTAWRQHSSELFECYILILSFTNSAEKRSILYFEREIMLF